ncbi:hypothetical protein RRG08_014583, partial [Elysia crispata]
LVKGHDKFQETCQKEKRELQSTITSVNAKYQMLESHQKDTEADLNEMKQHMETMKKEHDDAYSQHAQEYQQLKQDKENEIARIRDELADANRRNVELENNISALRRRLQEGEVVQKNAMECSATLKSVDEKLARCQEALQVADIRNRAPAELHKDVTKKDEARKNDTSINNPLKNDVDKDGTDKDDGLKEDLLKDDSQKHDVHKEDTYKEDAQVDYPEGIATRINQTSVADVNDTVQEAKHSKNEAQAYQARLLNMEQELASQKSGRNQILEENSRLQQALMQKQIQDLKVQQGGNQGGAALPNNVWHPNGAGKSGADVYNMKVDSGLKDLNHMAGDSNLYEKESDLKPVDKHEKGDLGQVLPPKLHPEGEEDEGDKQSAGFEAHKAVVNPNDEQKAQILEPFLPNKDKVDEINNEEDDREDGVIGKHDGGGEEGLDKRNARDEEEERDAMARREEEERDGGDRLEEHQNPLALRQLEVPENLNAGRREVEADEEEMRDRGGPGAGAGVGQQLPPAMGNREGEADKFGDNQYFGEADEEDRQIAEEEDGNNEEEEEEEGEEQEGMEDPDDQLGEEQQMNEEMGEEDRRMLPFN